MGVHGSVELMTMLLEGADYILASVLSTPKDFCMFVLTSPPHMKQNCI